MFTGLIQGVGTIEARDPQGDGTTLKIHCPDFFADRAPVEPGDSIAFDGVCLTAEEATSEQISVHLSSETLDKTTLSNRPVGASINLEPSLTMDQEIGGHFVSGHVDDVVEIVDWTRLGETRDLTVEFPEQYRPFIAEKGSIALDGISLTINQVETNQATVRIIPHTLDNTALTDREQSDRLNLEVDMLARYSYNQLKHLSEQTSNDNDRDPIGDNLSGPFRGFSNG